MYMLHYIDIVSSNYKTKQTLHAMFWSKSKIVLIYIVQYKHIYNSSTDLDTSVYIYIYIYIYMYVCIYIYVCMYTVSF